MSTRNWSRIAVGLAAAAALGGVAAGVTWANQPTGNAQAIAYAQAAANAYGHVPAVRYTEVGYVSMYSYIGKASGFAWSWGSGVVPKGWVRATERAVVGLHGGRVTWFDDVLRPRPCHATPCTQKPIEIVVAPSGNYWRFHVSGPTGACYRRLSGSIPLPIGQRFLSITGYFRPPVHQRGSVVTDATYAWDSSRSAAEIDTISASTKLLIGRLVLVSRGSGPRSPAFAFAATYTALETAKQPQVKLCP